MPDTGRRPWSEDDIAKLILLDGQFTLTDAN